MCFIFFAVPGHTIDLVVARISFEWFLFCRAELFFVVILVPMGNHSSSVFRRSTHIKVHVRCGLMPGPRTRNVGYTFRHSRSRSDGADRLHWSSNPNGNIARFVVARMCTSSCTFPSSQRPSCTHKPVVQQRTCNRERSCARDV